MKFLSIALVVVLLLSFCVAEAQLRPTAQPQGQKKGLFVRPNIKTQGPKNLFIQLELGLTSRSFSEENNYLGESYNYDYSGDASLAFINFNILPVVKRITINPDSSGLIEIRARATTGVWDFYDNGFSDVIRIPLLVGADAAYSYKLNSDMTILPYLGLGLGMSILIGDTSSKRLSRLYNIRIGVDMQMKAGMRAGIAFVFNRIKENSRNQYWYDENFTRHVKYNQILFAFSF